MSNAFAGKISGTEKKKVLFATISCDYTASYKVTNVRGARSIQVRLQLMLQCVLENGVAVHRTNS